jgi:putative ABC transport system ATP-binding protein
VTGRQVGAAGWATGVDGPTADDGPLRRPAPAGTDGPARPRSPVVAVQGAAKRYRTGAGEVLALDGVSLTVAPGELVAIVGPSGSGKSSLMHLVGGLDRPDAGTVQVAGWDLSALDDDELSELRRRHIGFVFQSFNLLPGLDARENVALPALLGGERWGPAIARAEALLATVGMARRARHLPSQLSGGEAQRVAVARALVCDPLLVLADEPTGNLDSAQGHDILDLLLGSRTTRRSVVVVTHDDRLAARADRVVRIEDGRVRSEEVLGA